MINSTKEELESAISKAVAKCLKEQLGEDAETIIPQIIGNTIIVSLRGSSSPAERHLANNPEGEKLLKELKKKLIEKAKPVLETMAQNLFDAEVIDIHSSFDVKTGERIEVFILDKNLEENCRS